VGGASSVPGPRPTHVDPVPAWNENGKVACDGNRALVDRPVDHRFNMKGCAFYYLLHSTKFGYTSIRYPEWSYQLDAIFSKLICRSNMNELIDTQSDDSLQAEYREVANNFRTLTDIRFKLLGFLPGGTAVIALSKSWSKGEFSTSLSLFGLAVTLALVVYNERNNQLYDELVRRAARLERLLGLRDGYFSQRPRAWLKIRPIPETPVAKYAVPIDHAWAIGAIYRISVAAWLFMLFSPIFGWLRTKVSIDSFDLSLTELLSPLLALIAAISVAQLFFAWFEKQRDVRKERMRRLAVNAVNKLTPLKFPPESADNDAWYEVFLLTAELRYAKSKEEFDKEFDSLLRRAHFYFLKDLTRSNNLYYPLPPLKSPVFDVETATYIVALLTDLPVLWLIDEHSGRLSNPEKEYGRERLPLRTKEESEELRKKVDKWMDDFKVVPENAK
jgi:hypothetical protein